MAGGVSYTYYANSKFVWASFQEGVKNDALNKFITRENWTDYDVYVSNIHSFPPDRHNKHKPIPDYIIYEPVLQHAIRPWDINTAQYDDLKMLLDPKDRKSTRLNSSHIQKSRMPSSA